ncbi:hypothetical protein [Sphingomonas montanisoli]|uniref:Uncharacterized protein n=1 Tax=Sphingomonas montanisoli TaxID=2606412 RepID=A0A5D9BYG9_9SPHN|nr:hypothetical protein [Sphingomonas montanisoli]TZG24628.1 hypothetical protein FYJ91_18570 [Sphingomonas montanisoli]
MAVAWACIAGNGALAGPFPPIAFTAMGYSEVSIDTLEGTPNFESRRLDPGGFLQVSADFNVDGVIDEARILVNAREQSARVVAVIQSPTKIDTYVLATIPLSAVAKIGIRLAPPASYKLACSGCAGQRIVTSRAGIVIFEFGGEARLETHPSDNLDDNFVSAAIDPSAAS